MKRILPYVVLLAALLPGAGCGDVEPPRILETSVVRNTDDTSGPYQVLAVVIGERTPLVISLIYSADAFATTKTIKMVKVSEDVFTGGIPGQPSGATIEYYIVAEDSGGNRTLDPKVVPPDENALTYRFRILAN